MKNFKKTLRRVMSHPLLNIINHSNSVTQFSILVGRCATSLKLASLDFKKILKCSSEVNKAWATLGLASRFRGFYSRMVRRAPPFVLYGSKPLLLPPCPDWLQVQLCEGPWATSLPCRVLSLRADFHCRVILTGVGTKQFTCVKK